MKRFSKYRYWIISAGMPVALFVIAAVPQWKASVRDYFAPEKRQILAKASGHLLLDNTSIEVVKVKNRDSMQLEIYKVTDQGTHERLDSIELPGYRNAHFMISKQASNLAIVDANSDGQLDIVSAFVDSKMTPRLVAFTWNSVSQTFEPLSDIQLKVARLEN